MNQQPLKPLQWGAIDEHLTITPVWNEVILPPPKLTIQQLLESRERKAARKANLKNKNRTMTIKPTKLMPRQLLEIQSKIRNTTKMKQRRRKRYSDSAWWPLWHRTENRLQRHPQTAMPGHTQRNASYVMLIHTGEELREIGCTIHRR